MEHAVEARMKVSIAPAVWDICRPFVEVSNGSTIRLNA